MVGERVSLHHNWKEKNRNTLQQTSQRDIISCKWKKKKTCSHLFVHIYTLSYSTKDMKWLGKDYKQQKLRGSKRSCGPGKIHEEGENITEPQKLNGIRQAKECRRQSR